MTLVHEKRDTHFPIVPGDKGLSFIPPTRHWNVILTSATNTSGNSHCNTLQAASRGPKPWCPVPPGCISITHAQYLYKCIKLYGASTRLTANVAAVFLYHCKEAFTGDKAWGCGKPGATVRVLVCNRRVGWRGAVRRTGRLCCCVTVCRPPVRLTVGHSPHTGPL